MKDALQPEIVEVCAASWPIVPLGEVCRIELGKTPARGTKSNWDEDKSTGNVWLSIADMPTSLHAEATESREHVSETAAREMRLVPEGTLLVSFKLTLGRLCYAGRDLFTNEAIAAILDLDETRVLKPFLYWYLTYFDWNAAAAGDHKIKGKTLNKAKLKALPIPLPPLEEQKRIVAVLDQAFAALNRARAHAEANLLDLDHLILAASRKTFDALEAEWRSLGSLCEIYQPKTISAKEMSSGGQYVVFGANGKIGRYHAYNHAEPQLLVTCRGATCGQINISEPFSWITGNAMVIRPKGTEITSDFLEHFFRDAVDWDKVITGAAQPQITRQSLSPTMIPVPALTEQDAASEKLGALRERVGTLKSEYQTKLGQLAALRQSLLQRAFSGELS